MRPRVLIAVSLAALAVVAIPAVASTSARRVVGNCTASQVRPAVIVLACADLNLELTRLHWSSFGGSSASATGYYHVNDCTPNCAAGRFHSYPVALAVSHAKGCPDGHEDYRRATVTFIAKRPSGVKASAALALFCPLKG